MFMSIWSGNLVVTVEETWAGAEDSAGVTQSEQRSVLGEEQTEEMVVRAEILRLVRLTRFLASFMKGTWAELV